MPDTCLENLPVVPLAAPGVADPPPRVMPSRVMPPRVLVVVGGGCPPRIAVAGAVVEVCVVDYGRLDRLSPTEHTSDLLRDTLAWKTHRGEPQAIAVLQDEIVGEFRAAGLAI